MNPNLKNEIIGGITTFLTLSYIVVVNPAILSAEGTGMAFSGVLTATVLLCFLLTLMMGLYARLPFAVAPGMGINAFFTYSIILGQKIPWQVALGMVFWSGVIFLLISATPLREKIAKAIPVHLRIASSGGIGIFLSFIGLQNAHFIEANPVTLVHVGQLNLESGLCLISLVMTFWMMKRKNPLAFLTGILFTTIAAFIAGKTKIPDSFFSNPDFESVFLQLDLWGALKPAFLPAIISIMFTDLFDSISTLM